MLPSDRFLLLLFFLAAATETAFDSLALRCPQLLRLLIPGGRGHPVQGASVDGGDNLKKIKMDQNG